jgi:hypothetical protein
MGINESCKDCRFSNLVCDHDKLLHEKDGVCDRMVKVETFVESGKGWRITIATLVIALAGSLLGGIYTAGKVINEVENLKISQTALTNTVNLLVWNVDKKLDKK